MYWYDTPDLISSVGTVQVQRGAGVSTNGTGAFGGSVAMTTDALSPRFGGSASLSYGSYNTNKQALHISSGIMRDHWVVDARLTHIGSDGYIDRAATDLKSYMLQAGYYASNTKVKFLSFGGSAKTYLTYNGVSREDMRRYGRRYHDSGQYVTSDGPFVLEDGTHVDYYDDQTDNYLQFNNQLVGVQDVVGVDIGGQAGLDAADVGSALDQLLLQLSCGDQALALGADGGQQVGNGLGLVLIHDQAVDDDQVAVGSLVRQGGLDGQTLDLLVQGVAVIAGLGAQSDATVSPLGAAGGTLTGMTGTLLAPRLAAAAGNFGAGLGALGALTLVGQEVDHGSVHYFLIRGDTEDGVGKLNIRDLLAAFVQNVKFHLCFPPYAFTLSAMMITPPLGPGIAPLIAIRLFSA
jgi:hypothetical protein